jgi:site-specific recombinase XerD
MWNEIAAWQEVLTQRPDLSDKTIALYTQDARRFATWLQSEHAGLKAIEVTPIDAKTYRDHLLAQRFAPATINRALISLMLFFDTIGGTNPFRHLTMIDQGFRPLDVFAHLEWDAPPYSSALTGSEPFSRLHI